MILNRVQVKGFGRFADLDLELSPGLNVITGPNEAGKSTLHRALLTLLFDKPSSKSQDLVSQRTWGREGMYTLCGTLQCGADSWELTKDFEQGRVELLERGGESLSGDKAEARLAKLIGGISGKLYRATASLSQQDWAGLSEVPQITQRLQTALTGGAEGVAIERIIRRFDERLRDMRVGSTGAHHNRPGELLQAQEELSLLGEQLAKAQQEVGQTLQAQETVAQCEAELTPLVEREATLRAAVEHAQQRQEAAGQLQEAEARVAQLDRRLKDIAEYQGQCEAQKTMLEAIKPVEMAAASEAEGLEQEASRHESEAAAEAKLAAQMSGEPGRASGGGRALHPVMHWVAALVAIVVCIILAAAYGMKLTLAVAAAGAVGVLVKVLWRRFAPELAVQQARQADLQAAVEEHRGVAQAARRELADRLKSLGMATAEEALALAQQREAAAVKLATAQAVLQGALGSDTPEALEKTRDAATAEYLGLKAQLQQPEINLAEADPVKLEEMRRELAQAQARISQLRDQQLRAEVELERAPVDPEQVTLLQERQALAQAHLDRVQERLEVLQLTRDLLAQARDETIRGVSELLEPPMCEHLATLTGGRYCVVTVDRQTLEPRVTSPETGQPLSPAAGHDLSCATREQVYLAARLALSEVMWPGDQAPPLLLDDPLVNFDPVRGAAAIELLRSVSRQRQVILFTCSDEYTGAADRLIRLDAPGENRVPKRPELILLYTNTTGTMAASDALTAAGLEHRVIPRPMALGGECGVAVLLEGDLREAAMGVLDECGRLPVSCRERSSRRESWQPCPLAAGGEEAADAESGPCCCPERSCGCDDADG